MLLLCIYWLYSSSREAGCSERTPLGFVQAQLVLHSEAHSGFPLQSHPPDALRYPCILPHRITGTLFSTLLFLFLIWET